MTQPLLDVCWGLIRVAAGTQRGTRARAFRMNARTHHAIAAERRVATPPPMIYSVSVLVDSFMRDGDIELEDLR